MRLRQCARYAYVKETRADRDTRLMPACAGARCAAATQKRYGSAWCAVSARACYALLLRCRYYATPAAVVLLFMLCAFFAATMPLPLGEILRLMLRRHISDMRSPYAAFDVTLIRCCYVYFAASQMPPPPLLRATFYAIFFFLRDGAPLLLLPLFMMSRYHDIFSSLIFSRCLYARRTPLLRRFTPCRHDMLFDITVFFFFLMLFDAIFAYSATPATLLRAAATVRCLTSRADARHYVTLLMLMPPPLRAVSCQMDDAADAAAIADARGAMRACQELRRSAAAPAQKRYAQARFFFFLLRLRRRVYLSPCPE